MALLSGACADPAASGGAPHSTEALRRIEPLTSGGDAAAAALLLVGGSLPDHSITPSLPSPLDAPLATRLVHHALDHVVASALGAGDGPSLAGSARIRRLAVDSAAPPDVDGDGTNLDDVLLADLANLRALAGASEATTAAPILALREQAAPALAVAASPRSRDDLEALRLSPHDDRRVRAEALGDALLLKSWTGAALGRGRHAGGVGVTAFEGTLALFALQQAVALDVTLLVDLLFDGEVFRPLDGAIDYEPNRDALWVPAEVEWVPRADLPDAPAAWVAIDRASELRATAALLRGAVELAWLTDPAQADPSLHELFVDTPLTPLPPTDPGPEIVTTWVDDVRPILHGAAGCLGCHAPPTPNSGFSVATYDSVLAGGASGVPAVMPFDHASSPLWLVLNGPWLPPSRVTPIPRMPFGRPALPQSDIDTVRRWIDEGAVEERPPPPQPRAGLDVARVMFRNIRALHEVPEGPYAGLLDRRSGATRSDLVDPAASGRALSAMAAFTALGTDEPGVAEALTRIASAAVTHLTHPDGEVVAELDLRTGEESSAVARLEARAALAAGLLAAGRVIGDGELRARGLVVAKRVLDDSWDESDGLFDTRPGVATRELPARSLATLIEMLHELQLAGEPAAREVTVRLLTKIAPVLPFSELSGQGEVLGDGQDDTDRNGVVEPGARGRAPLLAGLLREGPDPVPDPTVPVSWSRHLLPLFRARCSGCHVAGAAMGDYRVDTAAMATMPGQSGLAPIVPGDAGASLLLLKLEQRNPPIGAQMPLSRPPLEPRDLELVRRWIDEGARDR